MTSIPASIQTPSFIKFNISQRWIISITFVDILSFALALHFWERNENSLQRLRFHKTISDFFRHQQDRTKPKRCSPWWPRQNSLVVGEADDAAVILVPATVVLHARVQDGANRFVDVVRAHVLEEVNYFTPGRLKTTPAYQNVTLHQPTL